MKKLMIIVAIAVLAFSCQDHSAKSSGKDSQEVVKETASELLSDILLLDSALIESQTLEGMISTAEQQLEKCETYIASFPMAPNKPTVFLKAGSACRALKQPEKALIYLNRFLASYKDHIKRDEALFTKAFILDEDLNRKDEAKDTYTQLIQEHPSSVFKQNAELLLEQLYLTDEELLEKFRKQNQ
jgi:outer membrane protein assembly factor BamD (BamD/ComL family)